MTTYVVAVRGQERTQYLERAPATDPTDRDGWRFDPSTSLSTATRFLTVEDALAVAHRLYWCCLPGHRWAVVELPSGREVVACEHAPR